MVVVIFCGLPSNC